MKIALAQFNPIVGDIAGNTMRMAEMIRCARDAGAVLVVFGELSVVGYPPRDLLRKGGFVEAAEQATAELAKACTGIMALVGSVRANPDAAGRPLQNVAHLLADGEVRHTHVKSLLPTYDVFDETRYFQPGEAIGVIAGPDDMKLGVSICEDLWDKQALGRTLYDDDPIARLLGGGAEVIINLSASPFEMGKVATREDLLGRQAQRAGRPIVYVNQVGGNDELIFDGGSCVFSADGKVIARAKSFEEDLLIADLDEGGRIEPLADNMNRLADALKLGIADYVHKCGFSSVVFGLSGGIDSAVVAALAAEALGGENVHCLLMPSRYSSDHSVSDSDLLAKNMGVDARTVAIETMHAAFDQGMGNLLADGDAEIASENIQARIRGNLVMAWSNAAGHLPLATGNKSELAVGYCTLYGDMCGGLAPIGDVLKTDVYRLAGCLNRRHDHAWIPQNIIDKPPSAELKPGQVDQDKLPPYDQLDDLLHQYVEEEKKLDEITVSAMTAADMARIIRMVDLSEYKRQQAARVLKVSGRAFGMGRRVPIAQRFR